MNTEQATPARRVEPSAEDGFTIIEVIVTAVVVAIVMGATFGALQAAGRAGAEQRHHAESYAVAQKDQARMRSLQISQLDGLDQTTTVPAGGTDYTVKSTGKFVNDVTGTASCDEGTNTSDYLSITSTVTWPSIGSTPADGDQEHRRAAERLARQRTRARSPSSSRDAAGNRHRGLLA